VNAWERREGESKEAYAAFEEYYKLDADERSIDAAYQKRNKSGRTNGTWRDWSSRNEWVKRAEAYDAHMAEVRQKAIEKAVTKWEDRKQKLRLEQIEREMRQAEKIDKKIDELLALSVVKRKATDPKTGDPIVFMPAHAAEFVAAITMDKHSREIMRTLLDMPMKIERNEVTGKDGKPIEIKATDYRLAIAPLAPGSVGDSETSSEI
jgi:hypothetical protein